MPTLLAQKEDEKDSPPMEGIFSGEWIMNLNPSGVLDSPMGS
jgi:hypothetical protein